MSRSSAPSWSQNPSFRAHLIWVVTGTTAALLVVSSAVILLPLLLRFEAAAGSQEELGGLVDRILELHATLWPLVLVCLCAVMMSSWLLYQRMVSPLVRFVQVFHKVRDGHLPGEVRLRTADYLTREADALNDMTAALRARQLELVQVQRRLHEEVEELAEWATRHGDADVSILISTLRDGEKALADQLARVVVD
jgi:hypothetical protein